jgi:hypothetical protein
MYDDDDDDDDDDDEENDNNDDAEMINSGTRHFRPHDLRHA